MRILLITEPFPYPLVSAGAVRIYNLLKRISREHEVWFATLLSTEYEADNIPILKEFCRGILTAPRELGSPFTHLPSLFRFALAGKPLELRFQHSSELVTKINYLLTKVDFDIVHIEHSSMAIYLDALPPNSKCKRLLVFRNVTFDQYAHIFRIKRGIIGKMRCLINSKMMRHWEPKIAAKFDRCIALSKEDASLLLTANPRLHISVIPNGVDINTKLPLPLQVTTPTIVFVGLMNYAPNIDAAVYFCQEILPLIQIKIPNIETWIVGGDPPPIVKKFNGNHIHITGQVDDVDSYYERSNIAIVPLRAGSGTRLKILEAMALGRPVVSTTLGCEGLDVVDGEHLLIADTPEQFAEKTVRLLSDQQLYRRISANGRQLVETCYDWDKIAGSLMDVYTELLEKEDNQKLEARG